MNEMENKKLNMEEIEEKFNNFIKGIGGEVEVEDEELKGVIDKYYNLLDRAESLYYEDNLIELIEPLYEIVGEFHKILGRFRENLIER